MFAIAFDLVVADLRQHHPSRQPTAAYGEIRQLLEGRGFHWVQGSVYLTPSEDMAGLFQAIQALQNLTWFPLCVRDIRAFRVEQWSNFTSVVTGGARTGTPLPPGLGGTGRP